MGEPSPSHSRTPWFVAALQQLYEILLKKKISQLLRMLCLVTLFLIVPTKDCFQQCISLRLLVSDIRVTYGAAKKSKDQTFNFFISIIVTMRRLALVL